MTTPPQGPAAPGTARVPRSRLDALYQPGQPLPALRVATGVVASIDSAETATVLLEDDQVSGVVFLGDPPQVGDLVEVEVRGDLLVIRADFGQPNPYTEGQNIDAAHIVSSDTPTGPDPIPVPIGGSMRDLDNWYFLPPDTATWTAELDSDGEGVRTFQSGPRTGVLWCDVVFPVDILDTLDMAVGAAVNAGTPATAQLVLCYDPDAAGDALPTGDTQTVAYGAPVTVNGPVALAATVAVPDTITAATSGVVLPRVARLGIQLVGDGSADLTVTDADVIRTAGNWPVGSVWFDPDAATGGILTTTNTPQGGTAAVTLPDTAGGWVRSPGANKGICTAPPDSAGVMYAIGYLSLVTGSTPTVDIDFRLNSDASLPISDPFMRVAQGAGQSTPVVVFANVPLNAGETAEIWLEHRYPAAPGAATYSLRLSGLQLLFLPGAVRGGSAGGDPTIRYWDGDSWRPDALRGPVFDTSQPGTTVPPGKTATTTSCTRTPGAGVVEGQKVTLNATVAPTAAPGSVMFAKSTSATGPWSNLGTGTLSAGKATKQWTAVKGSWYFRATYQGNPTYATSNGVSGALTVAADQPKPTTKVKTVDAAWLQAYNGAGGQLSGSGNDTAAHQGYFSATHGNRKTLVGFNPGLPADAVVTSVQLICDQWAHWYAYAGGTLVVGWHQSTSAPATYPAGPSTHEDQSRHQVDTGKFVVNVTGWCRDVVTRSTFQGITIGPGPSESSQYYGYSASPGRPQLHLKIEYRTYT